MITIYGGLENEAKLKVKIEVKVNNEEFTAICVRTLRNEVQR